MSHVADLDAVPAVKLLLKGKDHDHLADIFLDLLHASGAPGPDLRADKVKNWNAQAVQSAGQAQVEVGEVDQDGCVRLAARCFGYQTLEAAADSRQVRDYLYQADHSNLIGVDQQFAAGSMHLLAAHSEEGRARRGLAQGVDQLCAVSITRGFAGGKEEIHEPTILQARRIAV